MKKVSVIVPVYNVEKYIRDCIESIISQTYKNWELLLIDDQSTDESVKICKEYEQKEERIKLFCNSHGGVGKMRNIGLCKASGEYITFIDSDDVIEQDFLLRAVDFLEKDKIDIYMAGMSAYSNKHEIYKGSVKNSFNFQSEYLLEEQRIELLKNNYIASCCGIVYSKKAIGEYRFDENRVFGEDLVFVNEILKQNLYVLADSYIGYQYRMRSDSLVKTVEKEKCRDIVKTYEYLFNNIYGYDNQIYLDFIRNRCVQDVEWTEKSIFESNKSCIEKYKLLKILLGNKTIQNAMRSVYGKTKLGKITFYPSVTLLRSFVKKNK